MCDNYLLSDTISHPLLNALILSDEYEKYSEHCTFISKVVTLFSRSTKVFQVVNTNDSAFLSLCV